MKSMCPSTLSLCFESDDSYLDTEKKVNSLLKVYVFDKTFIDD